MGITTCREVHYKCIQSMIRLASLQTSFNTLDEEIKMTSRRGNALDYVIIPRIEFMIKEVNSELDEQARDDFIRIKKVVQKKREKIQRMKEEEAALENAAPKAAAIDAPSMLAASKDPDLVF